MAEAEKKEEVFFTESLLFPPFPIRIPMPTGASFTELLNVMNSVPSGQSPPVGVVPARLNAMVDLPVPPAPANPEEAKDATSGKRE